VTCVSSKIGRSRPTTGVVRQQRSDSPRYRPQTGPTSTVSWPAGGPMSSRKTRWTSNGRPHRSSAFGRSARHCPLRPRSSPSRRQAPWRATRQTWTEVSVRGSSESLRLRSFDSPGRPSNWTARCGSSPTAGKPSRRWWKPSCEHQPGRHQRRPSQSRARLSSVCWGTTSIACQVAISFLRRKAKLGAAGSLPISGVTTPSFT
jgi:hypothetical protein